MNIKKQLKPPPSFQCALFIHNSETSLYDEPDVARGMVGSSNSCMNLQYYCWWFRNLANHLGFTLNTGIKLPIIYSNWCRISSINNKNWPHNVADRSRWRGKMRQISEWLDFGVTMLAWWVSLYWYTRFYAYTIENQILHTYQSNFPS